MRVARNEFVMVKTENFSTMKQTMKQLTIVTVCVLMLGQVDLASGADANPPEWMTYQGYLVDGNGDSLGSVVDPSDSTQRVSSPANYVVIFRVYSAKQGGTALWAEQQTVTVSNGYFSVLLGQGSQYGSELNGDLSAVFDGADASDRFIGITVDIGGVATEIAPRLRLVSSPFAFTASQARRLTDGSGNANFFKDGASLKLGAGSTPTLTLPEAGGASLSGGLTVNLTGWGNGLTINANGQQSRFKVDESWFNALTDANKFYFNKPVAVSGSILSYNQDTVLGPSNNTDTYLKISSSSDKITAQADEFLVQGDSKYLKVKFTSTAAELRTDASSIYINKPLTVEGGLSMTGAVTVGGSLSVTGNIITSGWIGRTAHNNGGLVGSYNNVGGNATKTNPIYVIGSSYKPAESTLSNMYGVGYTDGSASFIRGNASGWGLYVASDGDARTFLSSSGGNSYIGLDGGKLGIGMGNPTQALDVNGIVSIRGKYMGTLDEHALERPSLQLHVGVGGDYWLIGPQQEDGDGDLIYTYYNGSGYDSIAYLDPGADVWVEDSDIRLKKNIEPMGPVVDRLNQLEPVLFNLIKQEEGTAKKIGFIAQEVKKIFPELVYNTEADRLGLNYHDYGVLSVKAIQELDETFKTQNERLKSRIGELESEIAVLKARLANSTTLEDRIAKLEELVSKIGQGE